MTTTARRLRVEGRVQGVGYREWLRSQAHELELRGWVRNRRDGSVEALAIGYDAAVERLVEACRRGPTLARVTGVEALPADDDGTPEFRILPTV